MTEGDILFYENQFSRFQQEFAAMKANFNRKLCRDDSESASSSTEDSPPFSRSLCSPRTPRVEVKGMRRVSSHPAMSPSANKPSNLIEQRRSSLTSCASSKKTVRFSDSLSPGTPHTHSSPILPSQRTRPHPILRQKKAEEDTQIYEARFHSQKDLYLRAKNYRALASKSKSSEKTKTYIMKANRIYEKLRDRGGLSLCRKALQRLHRNN